MITEYKHITEDQIACPGVAYITMGDKLVTLTIPPINDFEPYALFEVVEGDAPWKIVFSENDMLLLTKIYQSKGEECYIQSTGDGDSFRFGKHGDGVWSCIFAAGFLNVHLKKIPAYELGEHLTNLAFRGEVK